LSNSSGDLGGFVVVMLPRYGELVPGELAWIGYPLPSQECIDLLGVVDLILDCAKRETLLLRPGYEPVDDPAQYGQGKITMRRAGSDLCKHS